MTEDWGSAGEYEATYWASIWGLPDLVYETDVIENREPGDSLLASGEEGLIVQVKTRQGHGTHDTPEKLARWINREVKKANRQFLGSRRMLTQHEGIRGKSLRDGFERAFPKEMHWKGVIILVVKDDHVPENVYPLTDKDVLVLTIQDWMHLCKATRSVYGVITYVDRVTRDVPRMLEDACKGMNRRDLPSYIKWHEWGELAKQDGEISSIIDGLVVPLGQEYERFRTFSDMDVREAAKHGKFPFFRPPHLEISEVDSGKIEKVMEWIHGDLSSMSGLRMRSLFGQPHISRGTSHCRAAIELLDKLPLSMKILFGARMEFIQKEATRTRKGAADVISPSLWPGYIFYVADNTANWTTGILDPEQRMLVLAIDFFEGLCVPDSIDDPVLLLADIYNSHKRRAERVCTFIGRN